MMHTYYIYCYENLINGKIYIGQTVDLDKRHAVHLAGDKSMPIDRALKKYVASNFYYWIISVANSQEQANQEEIFWIAEMRCQLGKQMVYNITDGGDNPPSQKGVKRSAATKQKLRDAWAKKRVVKIPTKIRKQIELVSAIFGANNG